MNVWVVSVIILFGLAELCHWISQFTPPLPVFILGGAFLAIASNHNKRLPFGLTLSSMEPLVEPTPREPRAASYASPAPRSGVNLPSLSGPAASPDRPISFEIKPKAPSTTDPET